MTRKRVPAMLLLLLLACLSAQAATVDTLQVKSRKMKQDIPCIVIAPDAQPGKAYPVLYLLHGHGGHYKTWLDLRPDLPQLADRYGMIIVCPEGRNSWYWDSPLDAGSQFETFVAQELVGHIDRHYPTLRRREGRAVTGLSMGGHGAMWLSIRHQKTFGAAGSMSGGLDIRPFPHNWNLKEHLGERDENQARWDNHTVINQLDKLENGRLALIIDCGYSDFFLEVNHRFHQQLLDRGIDHDYILRPGGHTAEYWRNAIDYQLLFFSKFFKKQGRPEERTRAAIKR